VIQVKKGRVASKPKVIGYLRVSTGLQELENQKFGILKLANEHGWKVQFVEETVSGRVSYKERELGKVVSNLSQGDVLIVSELSRLGRSMLEIIRYSVTFQKKESKSMQSRVITKSIIRYNLKSSQWFCAWLLRSREN